MRGLRPKGANPTHFFAVWGLKATTYVRLEETRFRFLGYSQIIIIFYYTFISPPVLTNQKKRAPRRGGDALLLCFHPGLLPLLEADFLQHLHRIGCLVFLQLLRALHIHFHSSLAIPVGLREPVGSLGTEAPLFLFL